MRADIEIREPRCWICRDEALRVLVNDLLDWRAVTLASTPRALGEDTMTTTTTADPNANQEDIVIEVLKDFPDNVAAFACHGHLTKDDYETVLIPHIEEKLVRYKRLRAYTEIAPDFAGVDPGALWEDTKFGFSHFFDWERAALVTDVEWMSRATKFFGFLMPGEWRTFPTVEAAKAHEWIAENQQ